MDIPQWLKRIFEKGTARWSCRPKAAIQGDTLRSKASAWHSEGRQTRVVVGSLNPCVRERKELLDLAWPWSGGAVVPARLLAARATF